MAGCRLTGSTSLPIPPSPLRYGACDFDDVGTLATVSQSGYYDHQTVSVTLPSNLAAGIYYIGGIADYSNQISESNEGNNTYNVVQVTVTAPFAGQALFESSSNESFAFAIVPGRQVAATYDHELALNGSVPEADRAIAPLAIGLHAGDTEFQQLHLMDFHLV